MYDETLREPSHEKKVSYGKCKQNSIRQSDREKQVSDNNTVQD